MKHSLLIILFLIGWTMSYGQQGICDSMTVSSLSELQSKRVQKRLTKEWYTKKGCKHLPTHISSSNEKCNPCYLGYRILVDTTCSDFYFKIKGPYYMELDVDSLPYAPVVQTINSNYYHVRLPDIGVAQINLKFWMDDQTDFYVAGYGSDSELFDYTSAREFAYTGENPIFQLFLGGLALLALINFIWFVFTKRKDIAWYTVYTVLLLAFFYVTNIILLKLEMRYFLDYFVLGLQPLFYLAYTFFVMHFLETKQSDSRLHRYLIASAYFFGGTFFCITAFHALKWFDLEDYFFNLYRIASGIIAFIVIIYLIRNKTKYSPFIVFGGLSIIIGSLLTMIFSIYHIKIGFFIPIHWMMIGTGLELIIFAAGIGFRSQNTQLEKINIQEALILEMEKTKSFQENKEETLNKEIEMARAQIQKEMQEKVSAEFSLRELEIELQSLRTQMNPHFIFNSLNSIKSFIAKNDRRIAADYLSKFAQLMRLILAHSKESTIPLSKEIEAIRIYVELEQMRFNQKFEFNISSSDSLELDHIRIQPLILQPFVENAIWHGLMHKEGAGNLSIQFKKIDTDLYIEIEDDGVGREKAKEYAENRLLKKKSYGMEITNDRLQHFYGDSFQLDIMDKYEGGPLGTIVRLILPIKND